MAIDRSGGILVARIHQTGARVFNRLLKMEGIDSINSAQGRILFVLWKSDGIPIATLARETGLKKSSLTSMLDRLEETGLVRRIPSPTDRRTVLIYRTEKDKALQRKYEDISEKMNGLFYKGFSQEEIACFENMLERILRNMTEAEKGGLS